MNQRPDGRRGSDGEGEYGPSARASGRGGTERASGGTRETAFGACAGRERASRERAARERAARERAASERGAVPAVLQRTVSESAVPERAVPKRGGQGRVGWGIGLSAVVASGVLWGCGDEGSDGEARQELVYCDVKDVLSEYCLRCHSEPPQHHAPFPLDTYESLQAELSGGRGPIWGSMGRAVSTGFMPMTSLDLDPPVLPLPEEPKARLLQWLEAGAPRGDSSRCE